MTTIDTVKILREVYVTDLNILPVTYGYIASLLQPYIDVIEVGPIEGLAVWIVQELPGDYGNDVLTEFTRYREIVGEDPDQQVKEQLVRTMARILFNIIIEGMTGPSHPSTYVLPWDVQEILSEYTDFQTAFNISPEEKKLPVTIILTGKIFTHMLSEEFTIGLLLASKLPAPATVWSFGIKMFGAYLDANFLYVDEYHMSVYDLDLNISIPNYSVEINEHVFAFQTREFMQGFITGCQWRNLDHHNYWKNLIQYEYIGDGEIKRIPLQIN